MAGEGEGSARSIANFLLAFFIFITVFIVGKDFSLLDAVVEGLMTIKAVFAGTIHFLMGLFSGSGSVDNLSGPVGIAVMAGTALDGGHFAILVIETLKRRPLSQRTYQIVGLAGISFFLILIFIVSYMDIMKLCLESSLSYINRYCGTVRI